MGSAISPVHLLANNAINLENTTRLAAANIGSQPIHGHRSTQTLFHTLHNHEAAYVVPGASWVQPTPGPLEHNKNPLSLALKGSGFFAFAGPEEVLYRRSFTLKVGPNGTLTSQEGQDVLDISEQPIVIPTGSEFFINPQGELFDKKGNSLAKIGVFAFQDERFLKTTDGIYFTAGEQLPEASPSTQVLQGYVEGSNTEAFKQAVNVSETALLYHQQSRMMQTLLESEKSQSQAFLKTS